MSSFKRWLGCLLLVFSVALLSMSCQAVFGDFKVGNRAQGAGQGGAGGGQTFGPIVVVPTSDLFTSDNGAQARFYVSLGKRPMAAVTIPVASSSEQDGKVSPASLVFTPDDYNAAQTVTVTGQPDSRFGDQAYSVILGPVVSDESDFKGAQATIPITNIDNDSAGVFITPKTGLVTTEAGGQAVFTVALNSAPLKGVTISLTSSDPSIGTVLPSSLTFSKANFSAPQKVTITGKPDGVAGGDRAYQISVDSRLSEDEGYAKLPAQTVDVINRDTDVAGVTVTLASGIDPDDTTRLRTSENGESATFTVVLNKQPTSTVTIDLASNSGEGKVSPDSLTFTPQNYGAPKTVTVVGLDNDSVADGNQPYQVRLGPVTSDDSAYKALTLADLPYVNVVNVDNDTAGIAVTLLTGLDQNDASLLVTSEKMMSATFSVALTSKPSAPVQITVSSTAMPEGVVDTGELDFTQDNWNVAQKVTVTGVDDDKKDGNVVYTVRLSAPTTEDMAYQKLPAMDIKVVNLDDDVAGITVPVLISGVANGKLITTEHNQGQASFSVTLTSRPKDDVNLPVTSSDTTEGVVSPPMLVFTTANYDKPQVVTVTGVNDDSADGDQQYTVTVGESNSNDLDYVGLSQTVKVTNQDDDSAYIVVPVTTGTTYENGSAVATFDVSLHSQPTKDVTLNFVSTKPTEGTLSKASMLFTSATWQTPQQLTVTGVDEKIDDGDQQYTVQITASSSDSGYMYQAISLSLVNKNDDVTGLKLTPTTPLSLAELGGKATFSAVLTSQPATGNVVVALTSSDTKQGTVAGPNASSPGLLTFTSGVNGSWSTAQTVTVTGIDNSVAGPNPMYTITLKTTSATTDAKYAALGPSTVSVTNSNEDVVGLVITPATAGAACATAPGTSLTYNAVLKSQPLGPVTLALASNLPLTAGTVTPAALTFSTTDWSSVHSFTVTGVDDGSMGMMTPYTIGTTATSTLDSSYNNLSVPDIACVNTTPSAPPPPTP